MRVAGLMLMIIAAAAGTSAQTTADGGSPPDVLILSQRWSEDTFLPGWDSSPSSSLPPGTTDARQIIRETSSREPDRKSVV